jgi:hypothetical protein
MADDDPVRLTKTMRPLDQLIDGIRSPRPWPDPNGRPPELAAEAWRRLFAIAISRMAAHGQKNLAHLTVAEATSLLYSLTLPKRDRRRHVDQVLSDMEGRQIARKDLAQREVPGEFLDMVVTAGKRALADPLERGAAEKLWRRCGGDSLPTAVWDSLATLGTPRARAAYLVAKALQIEPESVPVLLSRYRKRDRGD